MELFVEVPTETKSSFPKDTTQLIYLEDISEVYVELTDKLILLYGLGLILYLLTNAFFSYIMWYIIPFGKFIFSPN